MQRWRLRVWAGFLGVVPHGVLVVALCLLVGCTYQPANPEAREPAPRPTHLAPTFPIWSFRTEAGDDKNDHYRTEKFSFVTYDDVLGDFDTVEGEIYLPLPAADRSVPLVEVSPILAGALTGYLECRYFCRRMARRGFAGFFLYQEERLLQPHLDAVELERSLRSSTRATVKALHALVEHYPIDEDRLASFGISFGGIRNTLLAAAEPRLRANVICLAAGDLSYVISVSQEPGVRRYLAEREELTGSTQAEICADIEAHLESDPMTVAGCLDPNSLLLFFARFDDVVAPDASWRLHQALGQPAVWVVPAGHYGAVLIYPWAIDRSGEFLGEALSWPPRERSL
ncbi:MAG: hypothetical protein AAF581_23875 [Planctomycetota bacterium]